MCRTYNFQDQGINLTNDRQHCANGEGDGGSLIYTEIGIYTKLLTNSSLYPKYMKSGAPLVSEEAVDEFSFLVGVLSSDIHK